MNGYFLAFIFLFFLSMYIVGRRAGYEVLLKGRKYYNVVLIGAFVTTIVTLLFFELAMLLISYGEPQVLERREILETLIACFVVLLIALTVSWLWAVKKIKLIGRRV